MTRDELAGKINIAVGMLFEKDSMLFDIRASEWAIAHRMAVYLEKHFEAWNVDCEYNKVGLDGATKHDSAGDYRRPDIIIHHRGMTQKEDNLLVIEVKIKNSDEDCDKLRDFTSPPRHGREFQYQYGLALSFDPYVKKTWFPNEKEIETITKGSKNTWISTAKEPT
jgi:hypothetical protein